VPILVGDEVLAVLVFFKIASCRKDARFIDIFNAVATQLGSLIQRKQAEELLRIAQEKYHSIVENAMEGIFQSTPSGGYISANPALAKLYGYDSPEELMSDITNISQQLYVDAERRLEFVAAMEADNAVSGFESMVCRKDGRRIWVSENVRAVRDAKGELLYYEGTVSDITERKLAQEALKFQQEQSEKLLLNILPKPIAERLKAKQSTIADSFADVSVLFADIVGFTELSARMSPTELVKRLNVIFSHFDQLAEKYGVEKIKTIGDAYMVVGGLPMPRDDHAEAIAQMALGMQAKIAKLSADTGEKLAIRVGINSGPVVAGVIGVSKFTYDLWGDTVNVAARMEATGNAGRIQVTDVTYELLKDKYLFERRGVIQVKGKGNMMTYWLLEKK
jgi:adenylate cyclase